MVTQKNKPGIWKNANGTESVGDRNTSARQQMIAELSRRVAQTEAALEETEQLIDLAGTVLKISQPPKIGRMTLRWWKLGAASRFIEPVVVKWMLQANKVMTPKRITRFVARDTGEFEAGSKETQRALNIMKGLLTTRAKIKKSVDTCRRALQSVDYFSNYAHNERMELLKLRQSVAKRLLDEGHAVDSEYLKLEDED